MLYIFHGTDTRTSGSKARKLIASLRAKKSDAAFVEIDGDNWNPAIIEENAAGQGLFSAKSIVFLNRVTENGEAKETLTDFLDLMKESQNIFIILEGKVTADMKKAFEKYAEKIVVSDIVDTGPKKEFNIFALGAALGSRDHFRAWKIYREAIDGGTAPEGIVGMLFWKVKTMIVDAGGVGISSSASRMVGKYTKDELYNLAEKLVTIYHDSHRGVGDMEGSIERLLLSC